MDVLFYYWGYMHAMFSSSVLFNVCYIGNDVSVEYDIGSVIFGTFSATSYCFAYSLVRESKQKCVFFVIFSDFVKF